MFGSAFARVSEPCPAAAGRDLGQWRRMLRKALAASVSAILQFGASQATLCTSVYRGYDGHGVSSHFQADIRLTCGCTPKNSRIVTDIAACRSCCNVVLPPKEVRNTGGRYRSDGALCGADFPRIDEVRRCFQRDRPHPTRADHALLPFRKRRFRKSFRPPQNLRSSRENRAMPQSSRRAFPCWCRPSS